MYNRYIPEDVSYTRVETPPPQGTDAGFRRQPARFPEFLSGRGGLSGRMGQDGNRLSSLLKSFHLDNIDSGDILLLLIALCLWKEGDDPDLVIALGLAVLMGLWEDGEH